MKNRGKFFFLLVFLIGLGILLFPFVSQYVHWRASRVEIELYEREVKNLTKDQKEIRLELAQAYNETLYPGFVKDPWTELQMEGRKNYAKMLEVHEKIGFIEIPSIKVKEPIYAGTSETVLQKAVGHLEGTSLPVGGSSTHAVLTAHRGLPTARLFTDLDKVKVKDTFYINVLDRVLLYEVTEIEVIEPDEFDKLQIQKEDDRITLLTCTPYMVNSHRLLVKGSRRELPEEKPDAPYVSHEEKPIAWIFLIILLVVLLLYFYWRKKKRKIN